MPLPETMASKLSTRRYVDRPRRIDQAGDSAHQRGRAREQTVKSGDLICKKYRLQSELGSGSVGSVWAARNELTDRDFAIKFLLPQFALSPDTLQRFFHEARACGQITHPAIVDVYDTGQAEDGAPYMVMELLEGEGLNQRLERMGRVAATDVCRWLAFISHGLQLAHEAGLVHRDLRPGNIFFSVDRNDEVIPKVLDFGIATAETAGQFSEVDIAPDSFDGAPLYMSPEQLHGGLPIDGRSDLWALGIIMYEALSGQLPFAGDNVYQLAATIVNDPHQRLDSLVRDLPPSLIELVDRLLTKDPAQRVQTAEELAGILERIYSELTDEPLSRPETAETIPPPYRRVLARGGAKYLGLRDLFLRTTWGRVTLAATSVIVLGTAATGVWSWVGRSAISSLPEISSFGPTVSAAFGRASVAGDRLARQRYPQVVRTADTDETDDDPATESTATGKSKPRPERTGPHGGVDTPGF